jgi:multisubunit Na+/H+ antiporter MnhE subunit
LRNFFITFGRIISLLVAIGVFVGFAMLVGSVSQTETIIGFILASIAGLGTCKIFNCFED